ncbi:MULTISPECIES: ArsR/SmtB family transcription factor [Kocuria]|uniref:ArsR/SmtB family transcription factor n=1 Tax=Kocuria TaxID=57493 RepID=UPI00203E08E4|nr:MULTISPECIES: metalloregulator ArsR/SmtB family transcription factor [Kocuria]MCM3689563.1 metalloregulator ArsR/SmtB family transcription factor [Kocuria rosea]HST73243.1 metalloregulator ArsR/SmtB family transcription factor [Kocuria rosea]
MHDEPVHPAPDDEHARIAAETFRMLSDATRVKILWALFRGESSVNALAGLVGAAPAAVSQHLAKLRLAGLVESRRQGTFAYYWATDTHVNRLLVEALSHAEHVTGAAPADASHRFRPAGAGRDGARTP